MFGRREVCFPQGTTTFRPNISKMLLRPSSAQTAPSSAFKTGTSCSRWVTAVLSSIVQNNK